MDLSLGGKHVASARMIVKAGEPGSITQNTGSQARFIEVVASEGSIQNHQGILMKFAIGSIGKNGERTIAATPQILAKEGEPASLTQTDTNSGAEQLSLLVVVKKTPL